MGPEERREAERIILPSDGSAPPELADWFGKVIPIQGIEVKHDTSEVTAEVEPGRRVLLVFAFALDEPFPTAMRMRADAVELGRYDD